MDDSELRREFDAWNAIREARSAIALAKHRVEGIDELLRRLGEHPAPEELGRIVYALMEKVGDATDHPEIARALKIISDATDRAPSVLKPSLDRAVGRLLRSIDPACAVPLAMEWGSHRRKVRREWALKVLKNAELTPELSEYLVQRYRDTGETQFLQQVLRGTLPLGVDRSELFAAFDDPSDQYWQARVAMAALRADSSVAEAISMERPHAFAWAVGKLSLRRFVPLMLAALDRANDKVPLIGITVWALGQVGAKAELLSLEPLIDQLEIENPDPFSRSEARPD